MASIEELEDEIKKLKERVTIQDELIRTTWDFVQRAVDAQSDKRERRREEDRKRLEEAEKRGVEVMKKMKDLGYDISGVKK